MITVSGVARPMDDAGYKFHGGTTVQCEVLATDPLIKSYIPLTVAQVLVAGAYAALLVYATLALADVVEFRWVEFGFGWGATAFVLQGVHVAAYYFFVHQARASHGRNDVRPNYLVGAPVLRDVQLGVMASSFSWFVFLYVVILVYAAQGFDDHAIARPHIMILAFIGLGALFYLLPAALAQCFPVANMGSILATFQK